LSLALDSIGTEGSWELYDYTWDSTSTSDNYYLCEFDVQDIDTIANHRYIRIVLETDNFEDEIPTLAGAPSFEIGVLIISLGCWNIISKIIKKYKYTKGK
jgi:hypothetical protein